MQIELIVINRIEAFNMHKLNKRLFINLLFLINLSFWNVAAEHIPAFDFNKWESSDVRRTEKP